jgi:hypothetical protein
MTVVLLPNAVEGFSGKPDAAAELLLRARE